MKCIIAGSRPPKEIRSDYEALIDWYDQRIHLINRYMDNVIEQVGIPITIVVSGTAEGWDILGELWAGFNSLLIKPMPADWGKYGKKSGPIRNREMAEYAAPDGILVAVWDGKSKGTENMISVAKEKGLRVFVFDDPSVPGRSIGRTTAFEVVNRGSSPRRVANPGG